MALDKFFFKVVIEKLQKEHTDLPVKIGNIIQKHVRKNFDTESFKGVKWEEVQRRTKGTKAYRYGTKSSRTNPILTGTGKLRKSIQIKHADWNKVVVGVVGDAERYAEYNNDGTENIPQRQFMPDDMTESMLKDIDKMIMYHIDKCFE